MPKIRHIFLSALSLLLPLLVSAQATRVQGKVTDAVTGEVIPYVTVYFNGTLIGTSADTAGFYALEVEEKDIHALTAEISGYIPRSLPVVCGKDQTIDFQLIPDGSTDPASPQDSRYVRSILYNLGRNRSRHARRREG